MYFLTSRDLTYQYSANMSSRPGEIECWAYWKHESGLHCKLYLDSQLKLVIDAPYLHNHISIIGNDLQILPFAKQFCIEPYCFVPYQLAFFIYAPCPVLRDVSTYPQVIAALFELGIIDDVRLGSISCNS